jgi:hypothetical protein
MRKFILPLILPCVISGCKSPDAGTFGAVRHSTISQDRWYKPPPHSVTKRIQEKDYLNKLEFIAVTPVMKKKAIGLLCNASVVRIDDSRVKLFCGRAVSRRTYKGSAWYLVRGLFLSEATGAYSVISIGDVLWIDHASLGKTARKMERQALVVRLNRAPKRVFVTCSMIE